jgi:inhibitor of cysteine peptidase
MRALRGLLVQASLIAATFPLLVLGACAMGGMPDTITLSEADAERSVDLAVGQHLLIRLPATPSTGYAWELTNDLGEALAYDGSTIEAGEKMPGAPAHQQLSFTARAPGATTIALAYRRPWEKDVAALRTFSVRVRVAAR